MNPVKEYYETIAKTVIANLQKRNMEGYYAPDSKSAVELILSLMPKGSSIGYGGSMSVIDSGLMDAVKSGDYDVIDRDVKGLTKEELKEVYTKIFNADYFLMSTNAITFDGELINVDGRANRVSFLCYGPENVIMLVGMNKLVKDVDEGISRARNFAAPPNVKRLNRITPCAATGKCGDCQSKDCICCQTVITRRSLVQGRIKVVLVGETLGY